MGCAEVVVIYGDARLLVVAVSDGPHAAANSAATQPMAAIFRSGRTPMTFPGDAVIIPKTPKLTHRLRREQRAGGRRHGRDVLDGLGKPADRPLDQGWMLWQVLAGATKDHTELARVGPPIGPKTASEQDVWTCAPGRIRTCDTGFRRAVLYPLSYEGADDVL